MIIVSLLLIGVAATLLLMGLWEPSTVLLSASIGASLLAAVVLVIGARRPVAVHDEYALEWQPRHSDRTRTGRRAAADTRRALELLAGAGAPDRPVSADAADNDLVRGAPPRQGHHDEPARAPAGLADREPRGSLAEAARQLEAAARGEAVAARLQEAETATAAGADTGPDAGDDPDELTSTVTIPQQVREPGDRPDELTGEDDESQDPDGYTSDGLEDRDAAGDGELPDEAYLSDEPAAQQVSEADAARVSQLSTEVLVVDGRPRYHLPGCVHLLGRDSEPLPVSEAVELGFSPCSLCEPDSALLADVRRV